MTSTRPAFLQRLFGSSADPQAAARPLWRRVVEIARQPHWYTDGGVEDTVPGRFDMVSAVLSLAVLRMEDEPALREPSAQLIELFVADMDGQLREFGINDVVVGKHMGRLMSTLGGRMGAYRDALKTDDDAAMAEAARRNVTLAEDADPGHLARELRRLAASLANTDAADLLAGRIVA